LGASSSSQLIYKPTPIQEIRYPALEQAGIQLLVKREDLNHPYISGNKWWKLKYNIQQARSEGKKAILTFGGAYSNHIYATAAAAHENNLTAIGIIRGEQHSPLNPTLQFAQDRQMKFFYVSREAYKNKNTGPFIEEFKIRFGDPFIIPEGGTNRYAVKGCAEFAEGELAALSFDYLFLPVGTGGTMAGLICGLGGSKKIRGVTILKNGGFLHDDIRTLVTEFSGKDYGNWSLLTSYDHGGYAKTTNELQQFIAEMKEMHDLPLDPVYTGKLLWAVVKEAEKGAFPRGTTLLALHTGGLQAT
jgi:1-aminocyclopropane-1-carboxylate deaminase